MSQYVTQYVLNRLPRPGVPDARKLCRDAEIWHAWRPLFADKMNSWTSLDAQKLLTWRQAHSGLAN